MTPVMPLGGTAGPVKKKASTGYDVYGLVIIGGRGQHVMVVTCLYLLFLL